ncbi:MAG: hypothetical protein A2V66_06975 [Ignavibacteria bacterium RBG_13_36_8]|nr:MAG: hypothetical protein A2V66_06975 [Ignavibacteria bacterium RBG_13_36_8]
MNYDPIVNDPVGSDKEYPASLKSLIIKSCGCNLLSTLLLADGQGPHPVVLFLHGFPGNETNLDIAHAIRRMGWSVFLFHYRGTWGSDGDFSWENAVEDVKAAIDFLKSDDALNNHRVNPNRIVLFGYSIGGFAAMMHAAKDDNIGSVTSIAGFNLGLVADMIKQVPNGKEIALENLELGVSFVNGTSTHKLLDEMLANAKEFNLLNYAGVYTKKNILMIGATYDTTAPLDIHYYPLVKKLQGMNPAKFQSMVMETGHGFSTKRIELTRTVINWLKEIKF